VTNETRTWELGEKPGECVVNLGASGKLVGIQCGGPDNSVVIGSQRLVALSSALLEAAGIAGTAPTVNGGNAMAVTRGEVASVLAVLRSAAAADQVVMLRADALNAVLVAVERAEADAGFYTALMEGQRAHLLLADMDRCEHGRHSTDSCFDCPGGKSSGNQVCPPGTLIGHNYAGREIRVPEADKRHDPSEWRR
jgi:hypothetical protein